MNFKLRKRTMTLAYLDQVGTKATSEKVAEENGRAYWIPHRPCKA